MFSLLDARVLCLLYLPCQLPIQLLFRKQQYFFRIILLRVVHEHSEGGAEVLHEAGRPVILRCQRSTCAENRTSIESGHVVAFVICEHTVANMGLIRRVLGSVPKTATPNSKACLHVGASSSSHKKQYRPPAASPAQPPTATTAATLVPSAAGSAVLKRSTPSTTAQPQPVSTHSQTIIPHTNPSPSTAAVASAQQLTPKDGTPKKSSSRPIPKDLDVDGCTNCGATQTIRWRRSILLDKNGVR